MAATMATMTILNTTTTKSIATPNKLTTKPSLSLPKLNNNNITLLQSLPITKSLTATAIAGAIFSSLTTCEPALAVHHLADLAAAADPSDSRGLALLLPIIPAVAWVLFNILQPALNQLNRMREAKGIVAAAGGLGGLAALGLLSTPEANAAASAAAGGDNRGTLLLFVITPAVLWVLYNILQPALNQLNRMKSD